MENKWIEHYKKMVAGKLPNKAFYILQDDKVPQQGDGDIKLVSPGQQEVEQAKMAVKRKIDEFPFHSPTKKRRTHNKPKRSIKKKVKKTGKAIKRKKKQSKPHSKSRRSTKNISKSIKKIKPKRKLQSTSRRSKVNTNRKLKYF